MKKSKFLKKSLAMLLALMLVVAMIPLSASAQDISASLDFIYVDDNQVKLDKSFTVDVDDDADNVEIRTNEDLGDYNAELRVVKPGSQVELALTNANKPVDFATYAKDDKITLKLYDLDNDTPNGECVAEYVMSLNKVALNTTTNLDPNGFKYDGKGVVSATVDNDKKVIHVVLARNTQSSDEVLDQEALGAQMTVSTLDNAKIDGVTSKKVDVDAADTVTVVSESGGNQSTFTIDATYQDALDSFTITGLDGEEYEGVISDSVDPKDDVPDTITVILPESAICDQYGDVVDDPELAVSYVANGNITTNVSVGGTAVASDGSKKVAFTGLQDGTSTVNSVLATRLPATGGANQFYNLTVMLEESDDTAITYAQVNSTIADVDVDAKTIVAEVPTADNVKEADVVLRTSTSVKQIVLGNTTLTTSSGAAGVNKYENKGAYAQWTFDDVDLTSSKTVTVTAENNTFKQYTLTAKKVTNDTDATITAFWVSDGVNTYKAAMTGDDDITVTLPYMTTKIDGWKVYVTPASYAYATAAASNNQIVNGTTTLANLGVASTAIPVNGELTGTLVAHNKNTPKIEKKYTVHFVLTKDVKTGNELTDLDFTAQPTTNNTDKSAFRAITDENTFNAEVYTTTSADKKVGTLNIEVAPSLYDEDDLGIQYQNIITDFATRDGGLAFIKSENVTAGEQNANKYIPLKALTSDVDQPLSGHVIETGDQILVLGEEVARWAILNQNQDGPINITHEYEGKTIDQYGTLYTVEITKGKAETGTAINSMKVGNTNLTINSNGTITGKLAFSETVDAANDLTDATFIEFSLSDYARLFANADSGIVSTLFSKGDIDGDGEEDAIDSSSTDNLNNGDYKGFNNMKLAFERVNDANHSVKVYLVWGDRSNAMKALTNLTVKAEDRLTGGKSVSNYTFDLTWAAPCEDADIETFTLGGYTGVINNDSENGRTIKVQVPYDTDVTGLVANFTTSTGATVKMDAPDGIDFVSGVTSANYTNPVKLYVTSEDKDTTTMYTVTVEEGISFSDVNPGDWFYDNVMDAAQNGYVSGMGDGTFNPTGATTRAQFAAMIANAMGYEADPDVESMFPDVADNYWGKAAINFCYENGIITGYEDGTFQPEKTITRQEAAAILNNAFELAEKYGISTELFPDNGAIADWAADHVYAAKAAGLMKGDAGTGNFRPTSTITRAEAASIMMNAKNAGLIK